MRLNHREAHTVMAALKHWQRCRKWSDYEMAIATDYAQMPALNDHEIEDLTSRIRECT